MSKSKRSHADSTTMTMAKKQKHDDSEYISDAFKKEKHGDPTEIRRKRKQSNDTDSDA